MMAETIGFIGLGIMGRPMAHNLLKHGYQLVVHNRHQEVTNEFIAQGAKSAHTPKEVAAQSEIVITMLPDSPQVEEVYLGPDGVLEGIRKGMIAIDMSTISPVVAKNVARQMAERGVCMLDAPVSGGDKGAIA